MQDRELPLVADLERQLGRKLTPNESHLVALAEQFAKGEKKERHSNENDKAD